MKKLFKKWQKVNRAFCAFLVMQCMLNQSFAQGSTSSQQSPQIVEYFVTASNADLIRQFHSEHEIVPAITVDNDFYNEHDPFKGDNSYRHFYSSENEDFDGEFLEKSLDRDHDLKYCQLVWGQKSWMEDRKTDNFFSSKEPDNIAEQRWGFANKENSQGAWVKLFKIVKTDLKTLDNRIKAQFNSASTIYTNMDNAVKSASVNTQLANELKTNSETWKTLIHSLSEEHMAAIIKGAHMINFQRRCGAIMALTHRSTTFTRQFEPPGAVSMDGKVICRTEGQITQDYDACKTLVEVYDGAIVADQATGIAQQFEGQRQAIQSSNKVAENPNDFLAANKEAAKQQELAGTFANQKAVLSTAKFTALLGAFKAIPTYQTLENKARESAEANGNNFGFKNFNAYLEMLAGYRITLENNPDYKKMKRLVLTQHLLDKMSPPSANSSYQNKIKNYSAHLLQQIWMNTANANDPNLNHNDDAKKQQEYLKRVGDQFKGIDEKEAEATRKAKETNGDPTNPAPVTWGEESFKIFGDLVHFRVGAFIENKVTSVLDTVDRVLSRKVDKLLMNQANRQVAKQVMAQNVAEGIGNLLAGMMYNDAADDMKSTIKDAESVEFTPPVFEQGTLPVCLINPFLPECQNNQNGPIDTGFAGGSNFQIGGTGRNSVIGADGLSNPDGSDDDASGSTDLGAGLGLSPGFPTSADKSTGAFVDPVTSPGSVSTNPGDVAGGAGGGGAGAGGGGGGLSPAGAGGAQRSGGGGRSDVEKNTFGKSGSQGFYNSGSGLRKPASGDSGNPLEGLLGKANKGKDGNILNFDRGIAGIDDSQDIFARISQRYNNVTQTNRLKEYVLKDEK